MEFEVGSATKRVEDLRLTRGLGRYVDDIRLPGETHMVVVRSPHAAARIAAYDTKAAATLPGVLAVMTGADFAVDGLGGLDTCILRHRRDGSPMARPPYPILCSDRVRFAGDAVAIVVAESLDAAIDAAELVDVHYDVVSSVADVVAAAEQGAPAVWPQEAPDNECFFFELGDRARVEAAFATAHHATSVDFRISRVSANPLEPRGAIGLYDPADGRYTLYTGTQIPHKVRDELAQKTFFVPNHSIRV